MNQNNQQEFSAAEVKSSLPSEFFAPSVATTSMTMTDQSRSIAEVQASLVIARANPRNEQKAVTRITNACKRKRLAETAEYAYRRGGSLVTGPSIRLAEVLARDWGNMTYGYREIGRGTDFSEVEAFCHDLETNLRVTRQFQVKHWRDKKGGGSALTEERDKYEMVASQAQRRVRACILEVIPGDVVDMAVDACRATLKGTVGNIEKAGDDIIAAFSNVGVSRGDIESYLQRSMKSLVPADIIALRRIYTSITTGIASKDEFFKESEPVKKVDQQAKGLVQTFTEVPTSDEPSPAQKGNLTKLKNELMIVPAGHPGADKEEILDALDLWMADNYDRAASQCHQSGVTELKSLHQSLRSEYADK